MRTRRYLLWIATAAVALLSAPRAATAQSNAQPNTPPPGPPPTPCANNADNHRFDFWVGQWKVTTPGGAEVGSSHVDVISGGCALLENWRALNGAEGKSINTFDPATRQWRQFWVGQGGAVTDYRESEWHDGALSFFVRYPAAQGKAGAVMRLTFTPVDSATVRQHSELSQDGGATWTTQYDFYYHRAP